MTSKVAKYITESLATCGLAILNSRHAFRLRPDIWPTASECSCDWNHTTTTSALSSFLAQRGAQLFSATIRDQTVFVVAWSEKVLARRLEWITGAHITQVAVIELGRLNPPKAPAPDTPLEKERKRQRLRLEQLAAQEPPAHDCSRRTEILRARRELGAE